MRYVFTATVTRWEARVHDDWYMVQLPAEESAEVQEWAETLRRAGFGAVKVAARVGGTTWSTSIFPDASGIYSLVINATVRRAEAINPGDAIEVEVRVIT